MRRLLLLTSVLLALAPSAALAGGVNFTWGTVCAPESFTPNVDFACNTNAGSWSMVSSFMIDTEMTDFVGFELTMEATTYALGEPPLPDWWKLGAAPDCRANRAVFASDFSSVATERCQDWTAGQSFNAFGYSWDTSHAHILAGAAIADVAPFDMQPGVEYYAGKVTILNSRTVGTDACGGCNIGVLWNVPLITAAGRGGRRDDLVNALPYGNQWLGWNFYVVAARNTTWGQVKSLYR
jgi:hypothetical protein